MKRADHLKMLFSQVNQVVQNLLWIHKRSGEPSTEKHVNKMHSRCFGIMGSHGNFVLIW
jgi:hypothetical protein